MDYWSGVGLLQGHIVHKERGGQAAIGSANELDTHGLASVGREANRVKRPSILGASVAPSAQGGDQRAAAVVEANIQAVVDGATTFLGRHVPVVFQHTI